MEGLLAGKAGRREGCGKEFGRNLLAGKAERREGCGKEFGRNLLAGKTRREGCGKGNIVIVITWKAQRFQKPDSFAAVRVFQNTI